MTNKMKGILTAADMRRSAAVFIVLIYTGKDINRAELSRKN